MKNKKKDIRMLNEVACYSVPGLDVDELTAKKIDEDDDDEDEEEE